jgi:hypothetical protein
MLSPWSCQSPQSVVRLRTYSHQDLVKGFWWYRTGHVRAQPQLWESAQIVPVILSEEPQTIPLMLSEHTVSCRGTRVYLPWFFSGLMVDYQNQDMCFPDCHSNCDFGTIYPWDEISQFSINCILIYSLYMSSYTCSSSITVSGSHGVTAGAFRSQSLIALILSICIVKIFFCICSGILSHCSNRSQYVPTTMSDMCVRNGVLHTLVCMRFKYHAEENATSPVVQGMLYCSCSK